MINHKDVSRCVFGVVRHYCFLAYTRKKEIQMIYVSKSLLEWSTTEGDSPVYENIYHSLDGVLEYYLVGEAE